MSDTNHQQTTTDLVLAVAAHAVEAIGPNGTVVRVDAEDTPLARAAFIARFAEAATSIANDEQLPESGVVL
ncbi:hypothetical protein U2G91_15725 [Rhodococcoides fascians]|uniref:hypothetical protein n=1 Tax=Rhodococcoides fascians TaxID=1828 RepID=UPI002ACD67B7|nr:hypothetical protein [Rhodococcus fascians]WQH26552.1 hypothetical protein U2G91_15725 [Rhodococcus fascians]